MPDADVERAKFGKAAHLQFAVETPGLRNAALTAPCMHDGSLSSLEAVVPYYNRDGDKPGADPLIKKLALTEGEVRDLVAFLGALTDPVKKDALAGKRASE